MKTYIVTLALFKNGELVVETVRAADYYTGAETITFRDEYSNAAIKVYSIRHVVSIEVKR